MARIFFFFFFFFYLKVKSVVCFQRNAIISIAVILGRTKS